MKIVVTSVWVEDQDKALAFYRDVLGFQKKHDIPLGGGARWLTLVGDDRRGTELLLEPCGHPAAAACKQALYADGIPFTQFGVDDLAAEHERLVERGVEFRMPPTAMGPVEVAVFDDTCGNWIQLVQGAG